MFLNVNESNTYSNHWVLETDPSFSFSYYLLKYALFLQFIETVYVLGSFIK
jgi:hypothetical protein